MTIEAQQDRIKREYKRKIGSLQKELLATEQRIRMALRTIKRELNEGAYTSLLASLANLAQERERLKETLTIQRGMQAALDIIQGVQDE